VKYEHHLHWDNNTVALCREFFLHSKAEKNKPVAPVRSRRIGLLLMGEENSRERLESLSMVHPRTILQVKQSMLGNGAFFLHSNP
jgi:hypothetical protein